MSVDRGVRLVAFPGRMDGVFFRNELPYLKEEFSEVVVFTYPGNEEEYKDLSRRNRKKRSKRKKPEATGVYAALSCLG